MPPAARIIRGFRSRSLRRVDVMHVSPLEVDRFNSSCESPFSRLFIMSYLKSIYPSARSSRLSITLGFFTSLNRPQLCRSPPHHGDEGLQVEHGIETKTFTWQQLPKTRVLFTKPRFCMVFSVLPSICSSPSWEEDQSNPHHRARLLGFAIILSERRPHDRFCRGLGTVQGQRRCGRDLHGPRGT